MRASRVRVLLQMHIRPRTPMSTINTSKYTHAARVWGLWVYLVLPNGLTLTRIQYICDPANRIEVRHPGTTVCVVAHNYCYVEFRISVLSDISVASHCNAASLLSGLWSLYVRPSDLADWLKHTRCRWLRAHPFPSISFITKQSLDGPSTNSP